jgi:ABC-2 type transport system permease protein
MGNYLKTVYLYGSTTLRRGLRDPLTTIILFGLPIALLVIFGFFLGGNQDINVRTVIINNSREEFAGQFDQALRKVGVLKVSEGNPNLAEAQQQVRDGELDTIVELPEGFGRTNEQGVPAGDVVTYTSQANPQTTQIVNGVIQSVTDEFNRRLVGVQMPLNISPRSVDNANAQAIHHIFPIFTGLGVLLVGTLGIASAMPTDRKSQILRRLKATPIHKSQVVLGTGLAFTVMGIALATVMTIIAMTLFNMHIPVGSLATLAGFLVIGLVSMVGVGLTVGSWAKNPTQGEGVGQVIFLASMGLSGVWFPVALMPEFLQGIVAFMPLTPVIDGIRFILVDNASLGDLLPQLAVMAGWILISYFASFKLFRWE